MFLYNEKMEIFYMKIKLEFFYMKIKYKHKFKLYYFLLKAGPVKIITMENKVDLAGFKHKINISGNQKMNIKMRLVGLKPGTFCDLDPIQIVVARNVILSGCS